MYIIIWQYTVNPSQRESFLKHYHAEGIWAHFFQASADYFGTELLEYEENEFITLDKWMDKDCYEQFLMENIRQYQELDKRCKGFTQSESLIEKAFLLE